MSKRLLIVTDYFYPHWTGISKSLWYLTKSLQKEYEIDILTVRYDSSLPKREQIENITIIRKDYLFPISRAKYSLSLIFTFLFIGKRYDVIFINSPCSNVLPISILSKLFGKKLLIFHQGDLILPRGIFNRLIENVFDLTTKLSFHLADKIATYTDDYAIHSRVMKHYLTKFSPLLIPITFERKKPSRFDSIYQRDKTSKVKIPILFGFAGRFVEEKGFDILLDAIPKVVKRLPNARFVFAGETNISYERFFEQNKVRIEKVKKYLIFLGLLDNKELIIFYKDIDFIIIPSRSDCFNLVQAEAMLRGVPSIVADIPGARWLVKKTGFGKLFKKEDSNNLAIKIIESVNEKKQIVSRYQAVKSLFNSKKAVKIFFQT